MTPEDVMRLLVALRGSGVTDTRVLTAFERIDRPTYDRLIAEGAPS